MKLIKIGNERSFHFEYHETLLDKYLGMNIEGYHTHIIDNKHISKRYWVKDNIIGLEIYFNQKHYYI